ncbi:MAG: hypothetical protein NTX65_03215 [Ignavibacteriales bacterium]|nr:hypothetical protein [Ignavibacteriales bacterium]
MKNITELGEPLRSAIVILNDLQIQIAEMPKPENRKEDLLREMAHLNVCAATNALLGVNMLLVNLDTTDEAILQFAVDSTKEVLNKLKQQS